MILTPSTTPVLGRDKLDNPFVIMNDTWTKIYSNGALGFLCPSCYKKCIVESCSVCKVQSKREFEIVGKFFSKD